MNIQQMFQSAKIAGELDGYIKMSTKLIPDLKATIEEADKAPEDPHAVSAAQAMRRGLRILEFCETLKDEQAEWHKNSPR
jgi:hypothetical protein